ncbi:GNAT family N-acetyltransferase [Siccirubricoccus sp. G192]|uniref:GNAT family N-acetyltransferase n=1 Tax=Siccirubricoccus sp. G192 TaxID=2849651 RepID=UPI001C2C9FB6|nr:GNAT family N-acetyltransferase [Siccirubricoccus sp. G192]MBV1799538.1 GNAT family N-acetyltransferase [Siccirubricoccus sp. G192]
MGAASLPLPGRIVRTERLMLLPVGLENLPELVRLKADPRVFSFMLHGVRSPERTREELEDDIDFWEARGYGTWAVHLMRDESFLGITGLMERPDGRGIALRYALWPEVRGQGYAREAARAALEFGHRAGLRRIIAVARETNHPSRAVLGELGMREAGEFLNHGHRMLVYESVKPT